MTEITTLWTDGVFEIEVDVVGRFPCGEREWEVGATAAQGQHFLLVFRDATQPDSYSFLARRSMSGSGEVFPEPMAVPEKYSLAIWRESLKLSLELGAWGRALWLNSQLQVCSHPEDSQWRLFFLPDGRSAWGQTKTPAALSEVSLFFDRDSQSPNCKAPMSDWLGWTQRALQSNTDCRFALKFARLGHRSKIRFALCWQYSDLNQFERVCEAIGHLAVAWDGAWDGQKLFVTIWLDTGTSSGDDFIYVESDERRGFPHIPDLERAKRLWRWIRSLSGAQVKTELLERKSVAAWLQNDAPRVEIFVSDPTAHERMEATVCLRQWARGAGLEDELLQMLNSQTDT